MRPTPPLPALIATTKHRLLSTSLLTPSLLSHSTHTLPPNFTNPAIKERRLDYDIPVQVVDIRDMSKSLWDEIEGLEAERKGEMVRGREVIRVAPTQENDNVGSQAPNAGPNAVGNGARSSGPFKLLLEDYKGNRIWGFEAKRMEGKIGYAPVLWIGGKIMLKRGCIIARGMVLLGANDCVVLGGKVDGMHKTWTEGREERLRAELPAREGDLA